jgi:predicted ester cyclase
MTIEQNKAIANRISMELNKGYGAIFYEVTDPKAIDHSLPPGMPQTVESTKLLYMMFRAAFPDLKYTVEDVIAEGDRVVQRQTAHGTMTGALQGMPATGKQATWTETLIVRFENGKIVERWASVDRVGMLQQLGLMPSLSQN